MCMVSINVNEAELRNLRPELDSTVAIQLWIQQLVDMHMQQMRIEEEGTMDVEELRVMLHKTVSDEYAKP